MQFGPNSRKSIRYSIFIGVLAGSVFSGSGAFADPLTQATFYSSITGDLAGNYVLGEDIDISKADYSGGPQGSAPAGLTVFGTFTGTLDGANKTISGLTTPLFNVIGQAPNTYDVNNNLIDTVEIKNLNLAADHVVTNESGRVLGVVGAGALANNVSLGGTLENISVTGNVTGIVGVNDDNYGGFGSYVYTGTTYVGGLVGVNNGTIINSDASGNILGTDARFGAVGGLLGLNYGDVSGSTFTGTVQGERYVGGLAGATGSSTISNSSASGIVTGLSVGDGNIGGLVGGGSGTISNSTASVAVTGYVGTSNIGGLIGYADVSVQIIDSSSSGTVTGSVNVGGLAGRISGSLITNSSSSAVVNGGAYVGGLVGDAIGGGYFGTARGIPSPENGDPGYLSADIEDSFSTGAVNGGTYTGGLVGHLEGDVSNSYSTSSVNQLLTGDNAGNRLGGLVGVMASGSVSDSYATGGGYSLGGYDFIGGLIGWSLSGNITDSYASISGTVSGQGNIGGLVGYTDGSITNSYAQVTGDVSSNVDYVGGLAGYVGGSISNSYASISGNVNGNERVGGLVGNAAGVISNSYSSVTGNVIGTGNSVGGLAGLAGDDVNNSYAFVGGEVSGANSVGGLVGSADYDISDSYATGSVSGISNVGGLTGYVMGNVNRTYATGSVTGTNSVGGLVGYAWGDPYDPLADESNISNSYATGSVTGELYVGGLVGYAQGSIENSYAHGNVVGGNYAGGLVGLFNNPDSDITNSYASGQISVTLGDEYGFAVGGFAGAACSYCIISNSFSIGAVSTPASLVDQFLGTQYATVNNSCAGEIGASGNFICGFDPGRSVDEVLVPYWAINDDFDYTTVGLLSPAGVLGASFATDVCLNNTNPHLVSLIESYESSCNGGGGTPPPTRRERIEREFREVLETRTPEKIEKLDGFKKQATVTKDAAIAFVEPTEKIEVAKVKAVEVSATANVRVNVKADEALQISLKSESKEPVELWVKSPDGKWLLAGVITFDKDGKAILPPLKFKNVGNYSLVLSKPTADSAKGSAPLDQTGSVLVAVS